MSFKNDLRMALTGNYAWLTVLIIANTVIFLLLNVILNVSVLYGASSDPGDIFAIPGHPERVPANLWTIVTYMFVHVDFFHLFSNMLWLYFFGRFFSDYVGNARLMPVYLVGGLCGALVYVLLGFVLPSGSLRGASAAVMAVVVCVAAVVPEHEARLFNIWSIRLKYLALVSVVLTSILDLASNTGGKVAHLGGAVFGLVYGLQLRKGKNMLRGFSKMFQRRQRTTLRVEHRRPMSDEDYNASRVALQRRVDEILDKISRSGYDSLSKEEREFLHKHGSNV